MATNSSAFHLRRDGGLYFGGKKQFLVLLGQLDQQVLSLHQLRSQGKPLNQRAVLLASLLASLLSQHQWDPLLYPRLSPLHLDLHLEQ